MNVIKKKKQFLRPQCEIAVKSCIFLKENENTSSLLIIILVKSIKKEQIAQITQYDS